VIFEANQGLEILIDPALQVKDGFLETAMGCKSSSDHVLKESLLQFQ
jgi:hypothetical protein